MSLYPVINQHYGVVGELDIDDCAPTATIHDAQAADPCARRPTIPEFRLAAGNPDDPRRPDGLTQRQLLTAIPKIWPLARFEDIETRSWTTFLGELESGRPTSIAVNSAHLPSALRFGFYDNHRVSVKQHRGVIYCANPLAKNGSAPIAISPQALKYAMSTLNGAVGWYFGIAFTPQPVHLHFGGRRTSPFPDRTRVASDAGFLRSAPRVAAEFKRRPLEQGELFVAYQVTDAGDEFKGSSRWYGNHRGTAWIHASRLAHTGGIS
jgi:hypothetical protein